MILNILQQHCIETHHLLFLRVASFFVNLLTIFIKLLQSNHTLQELEVIYSDTTVKKIFDARDIDAMVQLVKDAASSTLKKLSCDELDYKQLLPHVPEQYQYILHKTN